MHTSVLTEWSGMMPKTVDFSGVIGSVSEDGHSAIVVLDSPLGKIKYAVITSTSVGRVKLMNGRGRLVDGVRVDGKAVVGVEALDAVTVSEEVHA